jgi:very-short-patch-repair endonuclease
VKNGGLGGVGERRCVRLVRVDGKAGISERARASGRALAPAAPRGGANRTHLVKVLGARSQFPVSGRRDERIAQIAGAQRGRVARRQLRAAGISDSAIDRLIVSGRLLPLHRGVFAVGHDAPIELGPETAALLAVRPVAALSHHSAAILWGLRPAGSGDGLIHLVVCDGHRAALDGVRVHRSRLLESQDVRLRRGLPVISAARALLDLAEVGTERELERAFDEALVQRLVRVPEVAELLDRADGRGGRRPLRSLIERQRGPAMTRSEAEERFLALIRSAQLPEPEVNVRVHGHEVDFLWRTRRLVVEIDGFRFHHSRHAFERDRRKDATLHAAGLVTMRVTWRQMESEPYAVIARLALALGVAASR